MLHHAERYFALLVPGRISVTPPLEENLSAARGAYQKGQYSLAENDLAELPRARDDALKDRQLNPKSPPAVLRFIDAAIKKRQNSPS